MGLSRDFIWLFGESSVATRGEVPVMTLFPDAMDILDIHTHHRPIKPSQAIQNCFPENFSPQAEGYYSVGLHPWHLHPEHLEKQWQQLLVAANHPQVLAIGEAGLDKLSDIPLALQREVFEKQVLLADNLGLPLVIHAVRAMDEVIALKKKHKPRNAWIVHGFRGKKEQALQYVRQGICLSFGEHYQEEALRAVPLDKLFLETDESVVDIHLLYDRAARVLGMPVGELTGQVQRNIDSFCCSFR